MLVNFHYYQPSLTAWGNRCLECGESDRQGQHIRMTWENIAVKPAAEGDLDPQEIIKHFMKLGSRPGSSYELMREAESKYFRQLLKTEDPFPPERHKGNRATVAYYDEADLVVRGNPRHARERVGIFKKLRNEYQDLKKYVNLSRGDKIVLGSVAILQVIYITVNVMVTLN